MMKLLVDQHRALRLLARSSRGCTEPLLSAHGLTTAHLSEILIAGLATATIERICAGGRIVEVTRYKITAAGQRELVDDCRST